MYTLLDSLKAKYVWHEAIFYEIKAKILPKMVKILNPWMNDGLPILSRINIKKTIPVLNRKHLKN